MSYASYVTSAPRLGTLAAVSVVAGCTAISGASDLRLGERGDERLANRDGNSAASEAEPGQLLSADAASGVGDPGSTPGTPPGDEPDANAGAVPSACPGSALFCDDFEGGNLGEWTYLHQTNGGTVTSYAGSAASGVRSMRALAGPSVPVGGQYPTVAAGARRSITPIASGLLAVRARFWMPKRLAPETTIIKALGKNGVDDINVKITSGGALKVDADTPGAGPELVAGAGVPPLSTWFCLEWRGTIGAAGSEVLLLDGQKVLDVAEDNASVGGYDRVQLGFVASDGSLQQELLVDDVVLSTQPIGCP